MRNQMPLDLAMWDALTDLRGCSDAHVASECALALFFLKYASDIARDTDETKKARFVIPKAADFYRLVTQRTSPGNPDRLRAALQALQAANPEVLDELFDGISLGRGMRDAAAFDAALAPTLEKLADIDLGPAHVAQDTLGKVYEKVLSTLIFFSHSDAGEMYTPRQVSSLLCQLINPRSDDHIYDPACGSAGLLLTCAEHVRKKSATATCRLYGQEINRTPWMISKLNLIIHGRDEDQIRYGDTLRNPLFRTDDGKLTQFDAVVGNPPFSLKDWGEEDAAHDLFNRFGMGVPPANRADYAFILHMLASMKRDTGRMAVVAAHGALFREGSEAEIRKNIIQANLLDAVIGLPPKLFYSTGIPTVVLFFRGGRKHEDGVLFVDASRDFLQGRRLNGLRLSDIEKIVSVAKKRTDQPGYSRRVSAEEVAENGFNLSLARYVEEIELHDVQDMRSLLKRHTELSAEAGLIGVEIEGLIRELW